MTRCLLISIFSRPWRAYHRPMANRVRKSLDAQNKDAQVDLLEAEAFRRALEGDAELLMFLLRAWLPERYQEHVVHEHSGTVILSDSESAAARARLVLVKEQVQ
jgi:hypothetical protein